jgi:hypothetical protein
MAAYCTPASLELYLGRALTDAESDSAIGACLAATDFIDRYTGSSWQGTTISGELQTVTGPTVRLDWRPVSAITSVTARSLVVGATPRSLVAGTDYELVDALNGVLLVNAAYDVITTTMSAGTVLTVTYVVGAVVPAAISLAANIIAAAYAVGGSAASGAGRGIQKLEAGSAKITYDPIERTVAIPPTAYELLAAYRPAVLFA